MQLGIGLGLGFQTGPPRAVSLPTNGGPELLLMAELIHRGDRTKEGELVKAGAIPWLEIVDHLRRDPQFLAEFARQPRKFEEFLAATYSRAGFDEVTLTPQRGDGGRDLIAVKHGFGAVRFLEQAKAYSPGHVVTHEEVRAMYGVLSADPNASKGLVTTTSTFAPGILKPDNEFAKFMPHRLELKDGSALIKWLEEVRGLSKA